MAICEFYLEHGAQWKALSLNLFGRTPTMIKNRFNTKLKNTLRKQSKTKPGHRTEPESSVSEHSGAL